MRFKTLPRFFVMMIFLLSTLLASASALRLGVDQEVLEYNRQQHDEARTDETALAVYLETADTYSGPYKYGYIGFTYDDPTGVIANAAKKITFLCKTDEEKANAIHDWIAENIAYDMDSCKNNTVTAKKMQPLTVYYERVGICEGYSNLMVAMLREIGVPAKKIEGYASMSKWPEQLFNTSTGKPSVESGHAWTEVWYDDEWHIYDATWDSRNVYEDGETVKRDFVETFKDVSLEEFSKTHLILDNGDKVIPDKEDYEAKKERLKKNEATSSTFSKVLTNNYLMNETARSDSTALAVLSETADTYTGPWEGTSGSVSYEDPDNRIADLSRKLTKDCDTDKDKIKAVYQWVANNIYYDKDKFNAKTFTKEDAKAEVVLERGTGVCEGYANLMVALLREAGFTAKTVYGYSLNKDKLKSWPKDLFSGDLNQSGLETHAWVEVYLDDEWHSYDVTWDSNNVYKNGKLEKESADMDYYDISIEKLSKDHYITDNGDSYLPDKETYLARKEKVEKEKQEEDSNEYTGWILELAEMIPFRFVA